MRTLSLLQSIWINSVCLAEGGGLNYEYEYYEYEYECAEPSKI